MGANEKLGTINIYPRQFLHLFHAIDEQNAGDEMVVFVLKFPFGIALSVPPSHQNRVRMGRLNFWALLRC